MSTQRRASSQELGSKEAVGHGGGLLSQPKFLSIGLHSYWWTWTSRSCSWSWPRAWRFHRLAERLLQTTDIKLIFLKIVMALSYVEEVNYIDFISISFITLTCSFSGQAALHDHYHWCCACIKLVYQLTYYFNKSVISHDIRVDTCRVVCSAKI